MATLKIKNSFKKILDENEAFDAYLFCIKCAIEKDKDNEKENLINVINAQNTFGTFLASSFIWSNTTQGFTFWDKLSSQYYNIK